MLQFLDRFGRYELDPVRSGLGGQVEAGRFGAFYEYATLDPDGFLAGLAAEVAGDTGGFATYGAARLVWEMYSDGALDMPAAWPLIDAGISFKSARGLPMESLSGYELQRLGRRAQDRELRRPRPE